MYSVKCRVQSFSSLKLNPDSRQSRDKLDLDLCSDLTLTPTLTHRKFFHNSGFSMIETLVAILLLGIVSGLFVIFFNTVFSNPKIFLKSKALNAAVEEINYSLVNKPVNDTSYFKDNGNLYIFRKVKIYENIRSVKVEVFFRDKKTRLTELSVEDKFEQDQAE